MYDTIHINRFVNTENICHNNILILGEQQLIYYTSYLSFHSTFFSLLLYHDQ